jgi:hypothetical protein
MDGGLSVLRDLSLACKMFIVVVSFVGTKDAVAKSEWVPPPARISAIEGWRGVTIAKGERCADCCDLKFPRSFGEADSKELAFLKRLVTRDGPKKDLACLMPLAYYALRQMKQLATIRDSKAAASLILSEKVYDELDLDGELAEVFAEDYQIPVLRTNSHVSGITSRESLTGLAKSICAWINLQLDQPDGQLAVNEFMAIVQNRGANRLVEKLVDCSVL